MKCPDNACFEGSLFYVPAKAPPGKETKVLPKPLPVSTKKAVQPVKQNAKQAPSMYKEGSSKLPRKVSAQLSNASDSASVTSSVKDQDNLEDLHDSEIDAVFVSTGASDRDGRVASHGHFQQDEIDAKVISPIEAPCRVMPPDILSETPYLSKHSIGVQVENDSDLKVIQGLNEKTWHLHELVKQRTDLCWQLQDQIDEDSSGFVAASVVILSAGHKVSGWKICECGGSASISSYLLPYQEKCCLSNLGLSLVSSSSLSLSSLSWP